MELSALQSALDKLDVANGNHWTADGQPRLDTVKMFAGNPAIGREQIEAEAPGFTRATAMGYTGWQGAANAVAATTIPATEPPAPLQAPAPLEPEAQGEGDATFSDAESAKQPEMEAGVVDAKDEVKTLEEALSEAVEDAQKKREALDHLTKLLADAVKLEDQLRAKLEAVAPKVNPMSTLQAYVAKQHEIAMARAHQRQAIIGTGVNIRELAKVMGKGSPLDQAMARKTGRGSQRPNIGKV